MPDTKLLPRIFYSLKMGWKYRHVLKKYLKNPQLQIKKVSDLSLENLQNLGVKVLVLDFDGVLAGDRGVKPVESIKPWLLAMYEYYQERMFVLSNKPFADRENYLKAHYPKLVFIKGVAKKPYPEGLLLIQSKAAVSGHEILVCDDRLLTGILAAEIAEVKALWVTQPIKNYGQRFGHELFFSALRFLDCVFLWVFG